MKKLFLILFFLLVSAPAWATVYYVRTDGGTAIQCTGTTDAAYPGSGSAQACAFNHPNWFSGIQNGYGPAGVAAAGDTLIIKEGEYKIGCDSQGDGGCNHAFPYQYFPRPLPSGSSSSLKTKVYGEGYNTGCASYKAKLWGTERVQMLINLEGTSNVDVECLELTDHSDCAEFGIPGNSCERDTYPLGDWGKDGIYVVDSTNLILSNLYIHGMAGRGVRAGSLTNPSLNNIKMIANGGGGWDNDGRSDPTNDGNTGTINATSLDIEWNGCTETYPGLVVQNCCSQLQCSSGGSADGWALDHDSNAPTYNFTNLICKHNTADCMDLLYGDGDHVNFYQANIEGAAGNQIKVSGKIHAENSAITGNCHYFDGQDFQAFSINQAGRSGSNCNHNGVCNTNENSTNCNCSDASNCGGTDGDCVGFFSCRGGELALVYSNEGRAGSTGAGMGWELYNNTITGEGTYLLFAKDLNGVCTGPEKFISRNNIFKGISYNGITPSLYGEEGNCQVQWAHDLDYGIANNFVNGPCPLGQVNCSNPLFTTDPTNAAANNNSGLTLQSTSPAIGNNAADETITCTGNCGLDINGTDRGAQWDAGAFEFASGTPTPICGDNSCNGFETCSHTVAQGNDCEADCGICAPVCGQFGCETAKGEDCNTCPPDCNICAPTCGDGVCNGTETNQLCGQDCPISHGDGYCNPAGETCNNSPVDCGLCPVSSGGSTAHGKPYGHLE